MTSDEEEASEVDPREQLLDQWDAQASGWARQAERWRAAARPVTDWLIERAAPGPGEVVLELAAGAGDVGLPAARRILPGGRLICSDAVEPMLAQARERAAEAGLDNVEFKQLQIEWIDLETACVDVVLCRFGLMFALDPLSALKECRRVLKPGGRLAAAVWAGPEDNPWKMLPQRVLADLGHVEPITGSGRLFGLSDHIQLAELVADAGMFDVVIEEIEIEREFSSLLDFIGVTCDLAGDFAVIWKGLDDDQRRAVRARLAEVTKPFQTGAGENLSLPGRALGVLADA